MIQCDENDGFMSQIFQLISQYFVSDRKANIKSVEFFI